MLPFWFDNIAPDILLGKSVIIAAHGNSIRAICKYLDNIGDEEIVGLNIPTALPLVYELDANLRPVKNYYLASDDELKRRLDAVVAQGKKKI